MPQLPDYSIPPVLGPPIFGSVGSTLIDHISLSANTSPSLTPSGSETAVSFPTPASSSLLASPGLAISTSVSDPNSTKLAPPSALSSPGLDGLSSSATRPTTPQVTPSSLEIPPGSRPEIGGGALFALLGARAFRKPWELATLIPRAKRRSKPSRPLASEGSGTLGGSIHAGSASEMRRLASKGSSAGVPSTEEDFPRHLEEKIAKFGSEMWVYREDENSRMARAKIEYDETGKRTYVHVVKPPVWTAASLLGTRIDGSEYLHVAPPYSPSMLATFVADLKKTGSSWHPKIVFEPTPTSCHPLELDALESVAKDVHVLSPNHEELLSFYGKNASAMTEDQTISAVEERIRHLLHIVGVGPEGSGMVVVRCGRLGACVGTRSSEPRWVPAYFGPDEQHRVVDVTGAGNSFLGGFVAGLVASRGDPLEAALYGTVSSSFMVEQVGLPELELSTSRLAVTSTTGRKDVDAEIDADAETEFGAAVVTELWNGELPEARLEKLRARIAV